MRRNKLVIQLVVLTTGAVVANAGALVSPHSVRGDDDVAVFSTELAHKGALSRKDNTTGTTGVARVGEASPFVLGAEVEV